MQDRAMVSCPCFLISRAAMDIQLWGNLLNMEGIRVPYIDMEGVGIP